MVSHHIPSGNDSKKDDSCVGRRAYHATSQREITPLLIGLGVAGVALSASYIIKAADAYQKQRESGKPMISRFSNFYDGGFEDPMTRREAALILGVRESATKERIQEAHRRLLMLNHPDTGGSTLISSKINEAQDMLLKNQ